MQSFTRKQSKIWSLLGRRHGRKLVVNYKNVCVLMCGGKGSRINTSSNTLGKKIEKPLIPINNKPLIEYTIDAILNSKKPFKIFAAVSSNTKETEDFIKYNYSDRITVLRTQGKGYSKDFANLIHYFINKSYTKEQEKRYTRNDNILKRIKTQDGIFECSKILFLPIDLPLISTKTVENIAELKQQTPLISLVIDKNIIIEYGLLPTPYAVRIDNKDYCHTGIAVASLALFSSKVTKITSSKIEEESIIFNDPELAFNVNTIDDLSKVKEYFSRNYELKKPETD